MLELAEHQQDAIKKLRSGSVLYAGVGSGKSRTALAYYFFKECRGCMPFNGHGVYKKMKDPKDLYIITTAKKRDGAEWYDEAAHFIFEGITMTVDSWNNITKYNDVKDAFFIFDEQRAVGYGKWAKSFIYIAKNNHWVMLTATPGDTWSDYIAVFIANGFYKNKTQFLREHVVFNQMANYPKIDHYINCDKLVKLKKRILVEMLCSRSTIGHNEYICVDYDKELMNRLLIDRWNIFEDKPIRDAAELCYAMRKLVNSDLRRVNEVVRLCLENDRVIIFYNFNYELDILRHMCLECNIPYSEWNGQKHDELPATDRWVYLVQYTAGCEGWNCITTNVIIFYSLSYSYKQMAQAAGRIDRLNTPYKDLYYYRLYSKSRIDLAIMNALKSKKNFNENRYFGI